MVTMYLFPPPENFQNLAIFFFFFFFFKKKAKKGPKKGQNFEKNFLMSKIFWERGLFFSKRKKRLGVLRCFSVPPAQKKVWKPIFMKKIFPKNFFFSSFLAKKGPFWEKKSKKKIFSKFRPKWLLSKVWEIHSIEVTYRSFFPK